MQEGDTLQEILELTKENNKILKGLRSAQRWDRFKRTVYLLILAGLAIFGYYYMQPYIETISDAYVQIQGSMEDIQNAGDQFNNLMPKR
ncbi:MAG: hypothetical protein K9M36_02145 [Candidatus Pacebacteria bacterium]|nr:hypothetical protein [Candidatus Paceibacterota bacterium]